VRNTSSRLAPCTAKLAISARSGSAASSSARTCGALPSVGTPSVRLAGFPDPGGAIDVLLSYVIGMSTTEAAWLTTVARSGETEAAFIARLMPAAQQAAAGYDHLSESYAAPLPDPAEVRDTKFANGLEIVLDGLALRLPRSRHSGTARTTP